MSARSQISILPTSGSPRPDRTLMTSIAPRLAIVPATALKTGKRRFQAADSGSREVQSQRAADAADARDEHGRVLQAKLAWFAEAFDPELPLVERAFVVGE